MSVDSGGLKGENDESEFSHPYFMRGQVRQSLNLDSSYRTDDNLKPQSPYQTKYSSPPQGAPTGPDQAQGLNCITEASRSLLAQHQERKGERRQRWRRHGMHRGVPSTVSATFTFFHSLIKVKVALRFTSFWTTRECSEPYLLAFNDFKSKKNRDKRSAAAFLLDFGSFHKSNMS